MLNFSQDRILSAMMEQLMIVYLTLLRELTTLRNDHYKRQNIPSTPKSHHNIRLNYDRLHCLKQIASPHFKQTSVFSVKNRIIFVL